jgi:hypothetical protein
VSLGSVGVLPAGVRAGSSEAREAGLIFGVAAPSGAVAQAGTFGFADFLDIINPLQHLPIIGTIYRELTGDEMAAPARILGDTLFGGPIGLISGVIESIIESTTGEDIGGHIYAAVFGDDETEPTALASAVPDVELASATPQATPEPDPVEPASIEVEPTVPPGVPAITGYQDALDAMTQAMDQYEATPTPNGRRIDRTF